MAVVVVGIILLRLTAGMAAVVAVVAVIQREV